MINNPLIKEYTSWFTSPFSVLGEIIWRVNPHSDRLEAHLHNSFFLFSPKYSTNDFDIINDFNIVPRIIIKDADCTVLPNLIDFEIYHFKSCRNFHNCNISIKPLRNNQRAKILYDNMFINFNPALNLDNTIPFNISFYECSNIKNIKDLIPFASNFNKDSWFTINGNIIGVGKDLHTYQYLNQPIVEL